jgi:hypothetical protein
LRKQTRSILDEISNIGPTRDQTQIIENRASHIISSAINLITFLRENFDPEHADELERRLLNSIRTGDPAKFARGLRKKPTTTPQ